MRVNFNRKSRYSYVRRGDGVIIHTAANSGIVRLYAQWGGKEYDVKYHLDENSESSDKTSHIEYDKSTPILTLDELGFVKEGYKFDGWIISRDLDLKYYCTNKDGKDEWIYLEDGKLPEGYSFLYRV